MARQIVLQAVGNDLGLGENACRSGQMAAEQMLDQREVGATEDGAMGRLSACLQHGALDALDDEAFPAVSLAREAGGVGGTAPCVYNAANEVAVDAFRGGNLPFVRIVDVVAEVLRSHDVPSEQDLSLDDVLGADAWAREEALRVIARTP